MTHEPVHDVHSDIAYMKSLAEEGRQAPVLIGPVLVAAAVCFGAATVGQFLIAMGVLNITGWGVMFMWLAAGVAFGASLFWAIRRMESRTGSQTRDNVAIGAAWSACGYTIFGLWLMLVAYAMSTQSWAVMALMPAIVMVAYGAAWLIAGQVAGKGWMLLTGAASFAGAAALGWFALTPWTYAIYFVMLVLVALLPGLHLMAVAKQARD